MDDVLGYEGRRVVVTGAASGMGEQTARLLVELGADVIALDIKPVSVPVARSIEMTLLEASSIEEAAESIDGSIDSIFSCAGLPGAPFTEIETATANFTGAVHLIEQLVDRMPPGSSIGCIASSAGIGWQQELDATAEFLAVEGFDARVRYLEEHPEAMPIGGYRFSKVVMNQWVANTAVDYGPRGIRVNCLNPGPTASAMMPAFHANAGKDVVDGSLGIIMRYSDPVEQAWPLVCLNSPRFSYVTGEALWADGGFLAALSVGRHPGMQGLQL
jgi:NAD(P)-dependent dehydrogenase (short-subunit alcohol dehydrogenase family)